MIHPLLVVYAVRDEPDWLVDDMRTNLKPIATEFLELDNRAATGIWQHEGELRGRQIELIRSWCGHRGLAGVWVLQMDPDERLEDCAAYALPAYLGAAEAEWGHALHQVTLSFPLREMWTPTAYRTDNGWADKKPRVRLFWYDMARRQRFRTERRIHVGLMPAQTSQDRRRIATSINLYHLKNIEPMNRVARAAAYLAADPDFQWQRREGRDWSWMYDETGLTLEEIPAGRSFTPPYDRPYTFVVPH